MLIIPAASVILILAGFAALALATRRAEARMGAHPTVAVNLRAYAV